MMLLFLLGIWIDRSTRISHVAALLDMLLSMLLMLLILRLCPPERRRIGIVEMKIVAVSVSVVVKVSWITPSGIVAVSVPSSPTLPRIRIAAATHDTDRDSRVRSRGGG